MSSLSIACALYLSALEAAAVVTEVFTAGALPFVGTVFLVVEGGIVNTLAELVALCLAEVADLWVAYFLIPSNIFTAGIIAVYH